MHERSKLKVGLEEKLTVKFAVRAICSFRRGQRIGVNPQNRSKKRWVATAIVASRANKPLPRRLKNKIRGTAIAITNMIEWVKDLWT